MKIPGFYVAHNITFDAYFGTNQVFKVGHTSDLRRRLHNNAFQTCFQHSFKFVATVETETTEKARQIETRVLRELTKRGNLCRRENGVWTEMDRIPMEELTKILKEITGNVKIGPCYPLFQEAKVAQIFGDSDI